MTKEYKVWVEVEEINLDCEAGEEEYEGDPVPEPVGVFATEEEARAMQQRLVAYADGYETRAE